MTAAAFERFERLQDHSSKQRKHINKRTTSINYTTPSSFDQMPDQKYRNMC